MNNVVSTPPSSYYHSSATSGVSRRSKFVAHSHALTHAAKASRVYTSTCAHAYAARPDKHLQALQPAKPVKQVKRAIYPSNRPLAQGNNAQVATEFIASIITSDIAYQNAKGAGTTEGTAEYNELNYGKLTVKAGSVTVQTATSATGKGKVDSSVGQATPATPATLKELASKPGMGWVNDVAAQSAELAKTNPAAALHIQNVQLAHDQWDYKQQGLTKEGAAIVTLVVAYFTAGAASGAGTALAAGVGATGTTAAVVAGATTAALSSLASQAAVSMVNNQGNLGAVLQELGSKESTRGLLTAMVTAGALNGLSSAMGGLTTAGGTQWSSINATSPFVDQLQKNLVNQLTSNVLQTALTGGNRESYEKGLQTSLLTAFISTGAAQGANAIGDMQANGTLNALTHKLAHAIAGCAAGAATASVGGGSAGNGCGSGAIGAVIGEITASALGGDAAGMGLLSASQTTDILNLAKLMAGVAAALTGGDINLAANAGGNAAENNALSLRGSARLMTKLRSCEGSNSQCDIDGLKKEMQLDADKQNQRIQAACGGGGADLAQCMAIANNAQQSAANLFHAASYADTPEKQALLQELASQQLADMDRMGKLVESSIANASFKDAVLAVVAGSMQALMTAGVKVTGGSKPKASNGPLNAAEQFEKGLVNLPPGERVATVKLTARDVAQTNGWEKDNQLSRINNRDVYKAPDGTLYSVDTQHGAWERINPKNGAHEGQFRLLDLTPQKPADPSGGHNLRMK
jgi:Possible hemagglutinin (DUF637)/Pre-toxin domain with VENN motif